MSNGYVTVTELPGSDASEEQLAMLYTRYRIAAEYVEGKDVLEVACGPGIGLGYLARKARRVTGGDYDERLLQTGRRYYDGRIPLVRLDAHTLPFRISSFDVVILFEAIYYLRDADLFLEEARRTLRSGGVALICSANRERHGFRRSSLSVAYFSAFELRRLLTTHGFTVEVFAAFPVGPALARNSRRAARGLADALGLGPKAKAVARRLLFGRPRPLPVEVTEAMAREVPLLPVHGTAAVTDYHVLYAIGRRE